MTCSHFIVLLTISLTSRKNHFQMRNPSLPYHTYHKIRQEIMLLIVCIKSAGWLANSTDPDQMLHTGYTYLKKNVVINHNKLFFNLIKCYVKNFFPSDVEKTIKLYGRQPQHKHSEPSLHHWLCWGLTTCQPFGSFCVVSQRMREKQ